MPSSRLNMNSTACAASWPAKSRHACTPTRRDPAHFRIASGGPASRRASLVCTIDETESVSIAHSTIKEAVSLVLVKSECHAREGGHPADVRASPARRLDSRLRGKDDVISDLTSTVSLERARRPFHRNAPRGCVLRLSSAACSATCNPFLRISSTPANCTACAARSRPCLKSARSRIA